jgi:hypothetical protein
MQGDFEVYKLFHDKSMAEAMGKVLADAGIDHEITVSKRYFDPSFAFNRVDPEVNLKLRPEDFVRANHALKEHYEKAAMEAEGDHYLFSFSDRELLDVVKKPDEWGVFDVELARRILRERGIEITEEIQEEVERERLEVLKEPAKASSTMVVAGYLLALYGGFFGIIIGWLLRANKLLPNGQKVPVYREGDRRHGQRIMWIGIIVVLLFFGGYMIMSFTRQSALIF